ncbi:hypothetical protein Hanom_Chr17g01573791 [Helianthus anomalus]
MFKNTIIHVLYLFNTHLYMLHVKSAKTHNIIELELREEGKGPLARKDPFRAKRPIARTPLSPQTRPKPINRRTTSLISPSSRSETLSNALKNPFAIRSHFSVFSISFFHFISFSCILIPFLKLFLQILLVEQISWMVFTSLLGQSRVFLGKLMLKPHHI